MNEHHVRETIMGILIRISPEADLTSIQPDTRFRDQFEFDSIDCLNLMKAIEKELAVPIPEMDYPQLATLNGCVRYLARS